MIKAFEKITGCDAALIKHTLVLNYDQRKKGRIKAESTEGETIGLFLERGELLAQGQLLRAENGDIIQIQAADEAVATGHCDDPLIFAKVCYHLGNRHVPLQVESGWIRFQPDHVLEDLAILYGFTITHEAAPFNPENGAYGQHGHHGHHHDHEHAHEH